MKFMIMPGHQNEMHNYGIKVANDLFPKGSINLSC
jgi:hypothetical protein